MLGEKPMNCFKRSKRVRTKCGLGAMLAAFSGMASALPVPWQLNMTPGVTQTSQRCLPDPHVGVLRLLRDWRHRVRRDDHRHVPLPQVARRRGGQPGRTTPRLEIVWTVAPIVILLALAAPATNVMINMAHTEDSQMTVKITGYQWKWRYEYVNWGDKAYHVNFISKLDGDSDKHAPVEIGPGPVGGQERWAKTPTCSTSTTRLILPTDTKVRFVVTGDDVIHAWWVPELGWKQDAIPGIINDDWTEIHEPGTYRGQCAELCGQDHGFMPIVVKAVPKEEFLKWLDQQEAALRRRPLPLRPPPRQPLSRSKVRPVLKVRPGRPLLTLAIKDDRKRMVHDHGQSQKYRG